MRRSIFRLHQGLAIVSSIALVSLAARTPDAGESGVVSSHVVVISIDGLRPDAIARYQATTLLRLQREGATSEHARTIFPSKTLPAHTSMLTGVKPDVHGITWNSDQTDEHGHVTVPTVFELATEHGFTSAAFFSKAKFRHLQKPGTLAYSQAPRGDNWLASKTVADVKHYLRFNQPNLLFVHIAEPDYAGHSIGWMSFLYGWAVRRADAAVATVLQSLEQAYGAGNYTVIVTADHGGHGREHGTDDEQDMTIPWLIWGRGVAPGTALTNDINTMDTAATVLWLLGVDVPASWVGIPVIGAFTPEARLAAAMPIGR